MDAFRQGRHNELVSLATTVTRQFPEATLGWKALGVGLLLMGRHGEALDPLQRALRLSPDDAEIHSNLGVIHKRLGNLPDAEHHLRFSLRLAPNLATTHCNLGNVQLERGCLEEAEMSYRQALTLAPMHADALGNLGALLLETGQLAEAEALCRRAVAVQPNHVEAQSTLAGVLRTAGRLEEAEQHCRQTLASVPNAAPILTTLAGIQLDRGQIDIARKTCEQAIEVDPTLPTAYLTLGVLFLREGSLAEAETCFRRTLVLKPNVAEALSNLGGVLRELGRTEEAKECCEQSLALKPHLVEAHINLGNTLRDKGLSAEAEACYRRALTLRPDQPMGWVGLGSIHADNGRFEEAELHYAHALDLDPLHAMALAGKANLRKFTPADSEWRVAAESALTRSSISAVERYSLLFALGKFLDDTGDYANAFEHFSRANSIKRKTAPPYDIARHTSKVGRIIAAYPATRTEKSRTAAGLSDKPVLVIGMPRSGTSLIEQIIASHPLAAGAGELSFWSDAFRRHEDILLSPDTPQRLLDTLAKEYLSILDNFAPQAFRVVDKMPGNTLYLGAIHQIFPNAKIVHAQRHPIDTCLSIFFQNFSAPHPYAYDLDTLAAYYREYLRIMAHWRATLPIDVFLEVPYEALVEDPRTWSEKIVRFLNLEWHEDCENHHKTVRRVGTSSNWQVRQPIYKTSAHRWRNYQDFIAPLLSQLPHNPDTDQYSR